MAAVKKIIDGCKAKYDLEEITIIEGYHVLYSGSFDKFYIDYDKDMTLYRNEILKRSVKEKNVFNHRKLFLFIEQKTARTCNTTSTL